MCPEEHFEERLFSGKINKFCESFWIVSEQFFGFESKIFVNVVKMHSTCQKENFPVNFFLKRDHVVAE